MKESWLAFCCAVLINLALIVALHLVPGFAYAEAAPRTVRIIPCFPFEREHHWAIPVPVSDDSVRWRDSLEALKNHTLWPPPEEKEEPIFID